MVGWGLLQNIKNNFWAIYVGIMHTKFQPASFNNVGGGGDRQTDGCPKDVTPYH